MCTYKNSDNTHVLTLNCPRSNLYFLKIRKRFCVCSNCTVPSAHLQHVLTLELFYCTHVSITHVSIKILSPRYGLPNCGRSQCHRAIYSQIHFQSGMVETLAVVITSASFAHAAGRPSEGCSHNVVTWEVASSFLLSRLWPLPPIGFPTPLWGGPLSEPVSSLCPPLASSHTELLPSGPAGPLSVRFAVPWAYPADIRFRPGLGPNRDLALPLWYLVHTRTYPALTKPSRILMDPTDPNKNLSLVALRLRLPFLINPFNPQPFSYLWS